MKFTKPAALFALLLYGRGCKHSGGNEMDELLGAIRNHGIRQVLQNFRFAKKRLPEYLCQRILNKKQ